VAFVDQEHRREDPSPRRQKLPGTALLRSYQRDWLRVDVLAGVTVAAYLVPQVMAYAAVAGLPPAAGLWATAAAMLVYVLLGSSRQLSVGAESTTALMTAVALGGLGRGDPARYAGLAAGLAIVVGLICFGGRVLRLGFLADLLSKPVLVGYMAGVAVIMVSGQLGRLTGLRIDASSFAGELSYVLTHLRAIHLPTLALAAGLLVVLFTLDRLTPRLPVLLIGMLLATATVAFLHLQQHGIAVVGPLPAALPRPGVPTISLTDALHLLPAALGVAMVAFSDNMLTGRSFASRHHDTVDSNQELLALGAGNIAAGLVQGFPISSSGSRTAIADALGSRTQLYSLVAVGGIAGTVIFLRPVLSAFPTAALGAVVVYAAVRLVDVGELRRIGRFRRTELLLAVATTVAVLVLGVLGGVLVALSLSLLDLLYRVSRPHDGVLGFVPGVGGMHDVDDYADARLVSGLVVYRYDSPLFFANADNFRTRALQSVDLVGPAVQWFVLNAEANVSVDITAVDALEELRSQLQDRGIVFAMARVKQELRRDLQAAGFLGLVGSDRIFMTLPESVDAYVRWYVERYGSPPPRVPPPATEEDRDPGTPPLSPR
jgi:sulfate permease, SulP family